jgi:hypothetical protein
MAQLFKRNIGARRLGPLKATLQFKRTSNAPWAIGVYAGKQQVGWLPGAGDDSDPLVIWLKELEEEWIVPEVSGECEIRGTQKHIVLYMPSDDSLPALARSMIAERRNRHPLNFDY